MVVRDYKQLFTGGIKLVGVIEGCLKLLFTMNFARNRLHKDFDFSGNAQSSPVK